MKTPIRNPFLWPYLLFLVFLLPLNNTKAQPEFFIEGPIKQLIFLEPQPAGLSMVGHIPLTSINFTDSVFFVNIFMFVPGPDTIIWIGQNVPIPSNNTAVPPSGTFFRQMLEFDLDPLQLLPADLPLLLPQVDLAITPPDLQPFTEPIPIPGPSAFQPIPIVPLELYIEPNPIIPEQQFDPILPLPFPPDPAFIDWQAPVILPPIVVERGCNVPNIDLDNSMHPASATYAGDNNACVPAGTANSFMWLREQHDEIDSLLNLAHGDGDTTHRKTLEDISACMNRANNTGVTSRNHAKGKQTFVDKHKLPVKVKYQSIFYDTDILSGNDAYGHAADNQNTTSRNVDPCWIMEELEDGEDVEMNYQCFWVDSLGNKRPDDPSTPNVNETYSNKHCVALTGGVKVHLGPGDDFVAGLHFKHDIRQDSATGTIMEWSWLGKTTMGGKEYAELQGKGGRRIVDGGVTYTRRCLITDAMSESFCDTVTFDTIPCPPSITLAGDTLCTGVIKADTICLSNVVIKGGQDILFKCSVIKVLPTFKQNNPTSTLRVDNSGCP